MTDTPDWVLKEAAKRCDWHPSKTLAQMRGYLSSSAAFTALCHAIEQHEAFRQEVNDAVENLLGEYPSNNLRRHLHQFIIRKPDPLDEIMGEFLWSPKATDDLRAALEARGLEIREKGR